MDVFVHVFVYELLDTNTICGVRAAWHFTESCVRILVDSILADPKKESEG